MNVDFKQWENREIELRTDTLTLCGQFVCADDKHIWLAETRIYRDGADARDRFSRTLVRVRQACVRVACTPRPSRLQKDYASIAQLPELGSELCAWVAGEEVKGAIVSHDPLTLLGVSGYERMLFNPDIIDTMIDPGRARMKIRSAGASAA